MAGAAQLANGQFRAFLRQAGQGMRNLGILGGSFSVAQSVNDMGNVTGSTDVNDTTGRAFLSIQGKGMRDLGTLGGKQKLSGAVNHRQEVAGVAQNRNGKDRAFLWSAAREHVSTLGTLGGSASIGQDLNDATEVVGSSLTRSGAEHAFLWTAARGMEDLGTLGGRSSVALAISETGEITGFSDMPGSEVAHAFLWTREAACGTWAARRGGLDRLGRQLAPAGGRERGHDDTADHLPVAVDARAGDAAAPDDRRADRRGLRRSVPDQRVRQDRRLHDDGAGGGPRDLVDAGGGGAAGAGF